MKQKNDRAKNRSPFKFVFDIKQTNDKLNIVSLINRNCFEIHSAWNAYNHNQ